MNELRPYDFDQTDAGWPSLDGERRYLEAAKAIESYIDSNKAKIAGQSDVSIQTLYFHAGQEYAMEGEQHYSLAIEMMRKSYKSSEGWNIYVDGSIAFLSHDELKLEACIEKLAALANIDDELVANANILQALIDGAANGLTYATIYDTKDSQQDSDLA